MSKASRAPRRQRAPTALRHMFTMLAGGVLWHGSAAATNLIQASGWQSKMLVGAALMVALTCLLLWVGTLASRYAAGAAFATAEGVLALSMGIVATPALPQAAVLACSFAALLAVLASTPVFPASTAWPIRYCRIASVVLASIAVITLAIDPESALTGRLIEQLCAALATVLVVGLLLAARTGSGLARGNAVALAIACAYSAWALVQSTELLGPGDLQPSWSWTAALLRLVMVSGVLVATAAFGKSVPRAEAIKAGARAKPASLDSEHVAKGELRLAELAGALDTQRQMNALLSHELRMPIATISAATQSLELILSGSDVAVDSRLARIHRAVSRSTELLEQLLGQDRLDEQIWTPRREMTDLADLARTVVASMQPDTAHALIVSADQRVPAYCDRPLTSVVLRNLIHNAIKYSAADQPVSIDVRIAPESKDTASIAVEDHGPGIDPQEQSRIFEPYFRRTAHSETQGLGIGLYLARHICQNQGGSLEVFSQVGQGTRFEISLPTAQPTQAANT